MNSETVTTKTTSRDFTEFVWYRAKVWFNPQNPLNHRGEMSLWSVRNDGSGISAPLTEIHDCDGPTMDAIKYFQGAKRNPELTRISQALEKQIEYWQHCQNDPYNLGNAVLTALQCVQNAIDTANKF